MAKLYIAEFNRVAVLSGRIGNEAQVPQCPPIAEQVVAIGGASAQSVALDANTKFVRVNTDAICSIAFGDDPTATVNTMRLAANQTESFGVIPGQKIAVISNT